MWRWVLTLGAWAAAVAVMGPLCFLVVMVLAGPHSSLTPSWLQPAVLIAGWVTFLVGPVLLARSVWRLTSTGAKEKK